jgi:alpha-amylase/alpha-mannosidase (GH57 family)
LDQGCNYTEEQKLTLLDWQTALISRILPAYQEQFRKRRIDVSFTPYYHPILPLLCDTDSALEATPNMVLPKRRFQHPEDAEWHVRRSMKMFEEIFGAPMVGMWPSEGSVSEQVADLLIKLGVKWIATDEEILHSSLRKSNMDPRAHPIHAVYEYGGSLKLFFRDHALSDRIGFVYSGWDADRAAADFVDHLIRLRTLLADRLDQVVVPVILDGENAWEYFPNDGREFLGELYRRLNDDPLIETVTMTEASECLPSQPLPSLLAGSWINHNFQIWIGHQEDNAAWDVLHDARDVLVEFQNEHPDFDAERMTAAWKQIYIAEGSDWCWWYGDEHRGAGNEQFDHIFRRHLMAVYEILGLEVPRKLFDRIYRAGAGLKAVPPDALLTPEIDGRLSDFYEWSGAGCFDCLKAGGAMHRVQRYISRIHFAYDHDWLFIRLDFADKKALELVDKPVFKFSFFTPEARDLLISPSGWKEAGDEPGWYRYGFDDVFELAVSRTWLFEQGFGELSFTVALLDGPESLENWPENEPIQVSVAEKDNEMFWPA